jgi:hypothetical protein
MPGAHAVTDLDGAGGEDVGAQAAAMDELPQQDGAGEALEVGAGLAERVVASVSCVRRP